MAAIPPISVYLEHVRSFATAQEVPIRPLTLLVGENNSGKSTLLAIAACVFDDMAFPHAGFNNPPFNLGTFDTIATFKGGKYGRDGSFTVGYVLGEEGEQRQAVKAAYAGVRGRPWLSRFEARSAEFHLLLQFDQEMVEGVLNLAASGGEDAMSIELRAQGETVASVQDSLAPGVFLASSLLLLSARIKSDPKVFNRVLSLRDSFRSPFDSVVALAPIRTKPRRTYDDFSEDHTPEGDHIPRVLARLLNEESQSPTAKRVRESLIEFGKESGLFKEVAVKSLGKGTSDPFQVQVGVGGPRVNLIDVGYGVSQTLPVLVQATLQKKNSLLLVQQPEVHLHPRAQAALGTFLAKLGALGQGTLLVETHSDHLIDRVRYEVSRGTIKPEQVQILFFDRPRAETTVYPIELDELGNVINAPECYRSFFLEEELQMLTREGS